MMRGPETFRIVARWSARDWIIVDEDDFVHGEFREYSSARLALQRMIDDDVEARRQEAS
jgi:hypothetical protein